MSDNETYSGLNKVTKFLDKATKNKEKLVSKVTGGKYPATANAAFDLGTILTLGKINPTLGFGAMVSLVGPQLANEVVRSPDFLGDYARVSKAFGNESSPLAEAIMDSNPTGSSIFDFLNMGFQFNPASWAPGLLHATASEMAPDNKFLNSKEATNFVKATSNIAPFQPFQDIQHMIADTPRGQVLKDYYKDKYDTLGYTIRNNPWYLAPWIGALGISDMAVRSLYKDKNLFD